MTSCAPPNVKAGALLGLALALVELDGLRLADGLTLGLTLLDGLALADGLTEGETLADGDTEADGLTDGDTDALGLTDGDTDGLTLGLSLEDGPNSDSVKTAGRMNETSIQGRGMSTVASCAPPNVKPPPLGDAELDGLTLGETDADGLTDAEGETLGLTDGDGLEMASRTANVTIARSSDVPLDPPTGREPWPAVVSMNTHAH